MLQQIFGGIGKINIDSKHESIKYNVKILSDLINVIIHYKKKKYPLLTKKAADFIFFSSCSRKYFQ
jgi:hypothetical protein